MEYNYNYPWNSSNPYGYHATNQAAGPPPHTVSVPPPPVSVNTAAYNMSHPGQQFAHSAIHPVMRYPGLPGPPGPPGIFGPYHSFPPNWNYCYNNSGVPTSAAPPHSTAPPSSGQGNVVNQTTPTKQTYQNNIRDAAESKEVNSSSDGMSHENLVEKVSTLLANPSILNSALSKINTGNSKGRQENEAKFNNGMEVDSDFPSDSDTDTDVDKFDNLTGCDSTDIPNIHKESVRCVTRALK